MKKCFYGAMALLVAAIAFDGCKKDQNDVDGQGNQSDVTIKLDPAELVMMPGKQELIYATLSSGTGSFTWTSENEDVATVNEKTGLVSAINYGETNIICTEKGGTKATCKVKVVSLVESFTSFPNVYYEIVEVDDSNLYEIKSGVDDPNTGKEIITNGYIAKVMLKFFSEGAMYSESDGKLVAPNTFAVLTIPVYQYYITHETSPELVDEGFYWLINMSKKYYDDNTEIKDHAAVPTTVDKAVYWEHVQEAIKAFNDEDEENYAKELNLASDAFNGAKMIIYEYNDKRQEYLPSWMPDAIIERIHVALARDNESNYQKATPYGAIQIKPVLGDYGLGVFVEADAFGKMTIKSNGLELGDSFILNLELPETAPARIQNDEAKLIKIGN